MFCPSLPVEYNINHYSVCRKSSFMLSVNCMCVHTWLQVNGKIGCGCWSLLHVWSRRIDLIPVHTFEALVPCLWQGHSFDYLCAVSCPYTSSMKNRFEGTDEYLYLASHSKVSMQVLRDVIYFHPHMFVVRGLFIVHKICLQSQFSNHKISYLYIHYSLDEDNYVAVTSWYLNCAFLFWGCSMFASWIRIL